jgi:hypothetical protein
MERKQTQRAIINCSALDGRRRDFPVINSVKMGIAPSSMRFIQAPLQSLHTQEYFTVTELWTFV